MAKTPNISQEKKFLDSLVIDYKDQSPYSKAKKDVIHNLANKYIKNSSKKSILQLGCSNGYETAYLADNFAKLDVVDGSSKFLKRMKKEAKDRKNVRFIYSLFEEYDSHEKKYDYIFCNYVLEHVIDVPYVLKNVRHTLKKNGLMFATVPNAQAFSRVLANKMGLVKDLYALTDNDNAHGHRRVYDKEALVRDFEGAGYEVVATEGVIFKILADFQLNKMMQSGIIGEEHIRGLQEMAAGQEDLCDSIFIVAKTKNGVA